MFLWLGQSPAGEFNFQKRWRSNFLSINWKISTIWLAKSSDISVSVWNTNRRIFEVFQKERWFLSYIGPCACTGPCVICALREHICVSLEPGIRNNHTCCLAQREFFGVLLSVQFKNSKISSLKFGKGPNYYCYATFTIQDLVYRGFSMKLHLNCGWKQFQC